MITDTVAKPLLSDETKSTILWTTGALTLLGIVSAAVWAMTDFETPHPDFDKFDLTQSIGAVLFFASFAIAYAVEMYALHRINHNKEANLNSRVSKTLAIFVVGVGITMGGGALGWLAFINADRSDAPTPAHGFQDFASTDAYIAYGAIAAAAILFALVYHYQGDKIKATVGKYLPSSSTEENKLGGNEPLLSAQ